MIGAASNSKCTCSARPSAPSSTTLASFIPCAHSGYAAKSAITAITSAGVASTMMLDVVCSAMVLVLTSKDCCGGAGTGPPGGGFRQGKAN